MGAEKVLEQWFRTEVKKRGGLALKFTSPSFAGVPDRIVLFPQGRIYFVEMKSPGKKPTPVQRKVHAIFEKLGFPVWVLDNKESANKFFNEL